MKIQSIRKITAVLMSIAMLQVVGTDWMTAAASGTSTNNEEMGLEFLPDDLLTSLEQELSSAVQLDENTANDLYSIGTINEDGTRSLITFTQPIKYYDNETESIQFIDNTLIEDRKENDVKYVNKSNVYHVSFPESLNDGLDFSCDDFEFNMRPAGIIGDEKPDVSESEIVYDNVFDHCTSVKYVLENAGFKESIIVNEPNGCSSYDFVFTAENLIPSTTSGQTITFVDEISGDPVYVIQPTYIADSYSGEYVEGESHITYNNSYEVSELSEGTYLIRMNLDEEFLNSDSTVYPCIIDPSVWAISYYNDSSAYVVASGGSSHIGSELCAGTFNGIGEGISYVKATDIHKLRWIEPNRLQSAAFRVKDSSSGYSNGCTINCYDSNTTVDVASVTYSGLLSSLGTLQSSTTFTTLGATYSFNLTSLFRQWIRYELGEGGKNPAYGFILRGASGASSPGRYFSSTSSSNTYFYLVYQEGEEIEDGFYNIKNVSTGTYLRYNSGGQLYLSSAPSSDYCKWQAILSKSADGSTTYGRYDIRPFNNLNTTMKGVTTNEAVTTNSSGNLFRIIRNADDTFRIMPAGANYARVSNAIGVSYVNGLYRAVIQEYSNINSMKWTLEPVVNRYFSKYSPDRFNSDTVKERMNCYGYAMGYMLRYDLTGELPYKQTPGEFENQSAINAGSFQRLSDGISADNLLNKIANNMSLDATRFGYTITEYTPVGNTIEQFGANSRLIAVVGAFTQQSNVYSRYHFYMQHNDGTWSHKQGEDAVTNYYDISGTGRVYLTNENIQIYAGDSSNPASVYNEYISGRVRYYIVTKDAVADYPHARKTPSGSNPPTAVTETYYKDKAGDCMFTATTISTGTKDACFDAYNDIDFYVFNSSAGIYNLTTSCQNGNDIDCDIYDYNGDLIQVDHNAGQVNITFSATGNKNYFIKLYNYNQNLVNYTLTLS